MKYQIGDKVIYKDKPYTISGSQEITTYTTALGSMKDDMESKSISVKISYELQDDEENTVYGVQEYELSEKSEEDIYDFDEDAEYALRNGLIGTYCTICNMLETEDGINIPVELYKKDGSCKVCNDFDIVNKKDTKKHCLNVLDDDFDDEDDEEEDNDEEDYSESITLTSKDGKYYIKFFDSPFGVMADLPASIEEKIKKCFEDWR